MEQGNRDKGHQSHLGNYIKWQTRSQVETIKRELGWREQEVEGIPPQYNYEKIECRWQRVRDYCKYIKRGDGRLFESIGYY